MPHSISRELWGTRWRGGEILYKEQTILCTLMKVDKAVCSSSEFISISYKYLLICTRLPYQAFFFINITAVCTSKYCTGDVK